jgi:hypothetical protein
LELRRKILEEAFGRHTVHVDLSYDHPLLPADAPVPEGTPYQKGHGGTLLDPHGDIAHLQVMRDNAAPEQWIWESSVCHRGCPVDAFWRNPAAHAGEDRCRNGLFNLQVCKTWPGEWPDSCRIGVMGWLKTCRQA